MDPVGLQEINQENDGTQGPGQRIGPENYIDNRDDFHNDTDIGNSDNTPAAHHDKHGDRRLSRTAQNPGNAVGKCQQEIEERNRTRLCGSIGDYFGIIVKCSYEYRRKGINQDTHQLGHSDGAEDAETCAFFRSVIFFCPQVLADKSGHGHGEAGDGKEAEPFDFGIGAAACHGHFAEAVDIGLHYNISDGNNGVLEAGGQAVLNNLLQEKEVKTDFTDMHPVILRASGKADDTQSRTHKLGNDGCQRRAAHAKTEYAYKQQVKQNIDNRGNNQVNQRMSAVPTD